MKHTNVILLVAVLCSSIAVASDLPDFPFVHSIGLATTNVAPTDATIRLTIECYSQTSSNAVSEVENTGRKLVDALCEKYGVLSENITANNISKSSVHRRGENYEILEITGYKVSRRVTIDVTSIEVFSSVMHMIVSLDHVTGIAAEFNHSDEEVISRALTATACGEALLESKLLAEASGVELGSLYAISSYGFSGLAEGFIPYMSNSNDLYGDPLMPDLDSHLSFAVPSTIEYEASVATIYKLK